MRTINCFNEKRIGISTNIFHGILFRDVLSALVQLSQSFSVIEIELEDGFKALLDTISPDPLRAQNVEAWNIVNQLQSLKKSQQLDLSIHAPYIGKDCDLAAEDEAVREESCRLLKQSIEFCSLLGVERLVYHPGYQVELSLKKGLENLKLSLLELVPLAADKGIKLCLENTGDCRPAFLTFSPAQYVELAQETGTFLTLDLVHHTSLFATAEKTLGDTFFKTAEAMLPYVRNIHIADMNIPNHAHLPIGKGNLPIVELLDFLSRNNYAGNVIIEEVGGGFSSQQFLESASTFKKQYKEQYSNAMLVETCT